MDDLRVGEKFFGVPVVTLSEGVRAGHAPVVISSLKRREEMVQALLALGISPVRIHMNISGAV